MIGARISGVQVLVNTGFSGESPGIRIRGVSGLTSPRDPLLFVDDVRVESGVTTQYSPILGQMPFGYQAGRFNDLSPDEIESIEIVKGPSAATLYGSEAANGVIVVRTKRGEAGRTRWQFSGDVGTLEPSVRFRDNFYNWGHDRLTGAPQQCA